MKDTLEKKTRNIIIKYITKYLKKREWDMKPVFLNIRKTLKDQKPITENQFYSIIKFIELERPFRKLDRLKIVKYFRPIIHKFKDKEPIATLENYINWRWIYFKVISL